MHRPDGLVPSRIETERLRTILEIAIDLATQDPAIEVAVLRGVTVDHPRYRDRHVFSAGINPDGGRPLLTPGKA